MKTFIIFIGFIFIFAPAAFSKNHEFPSAHSQMASEFLEPLLDYTSFKISSGSFHECTVTETPSANMTTYACLTAGTVLELRNSVNSYSVELKNAFLMQNFYQQKEIHQIRFSGRIKNHPKLLDGEKIVLFFWYPLENTGEVRGWVELKGIGISKPFIIKPSTNLN